MAVVFKTVEVEVDVDIDELIADASDAEKREILHRLTGNTHPTHDSPDRLERLVESAYLRARKMADLPREIADLFWHVHGRAI